MIDRYEPFPLAVLAPDKCCLLRVPPVLYLEFGQDGPDSTRLFDAIALEIGLDGITYIIDAADSSIKVFGNAGHLMQRFPAGAEPYRIQLYENRLYILDKADNTIREHELNGAPTGRVLDSGTQGEITAFGVQDGIFAVADRGGKRLVLLSMAGEVYETWDDYCYRDIAFTFGEIANFHFYRWGNFEYHPWGNFIVVDRERNFLIDFTGEEN
jgi:hypothetical protein